MDFNTKGAKVLVYTIKKRVGNTNKTLDYEIWKSERILSFLCIHRLKLFFQISGPLLPITLYDHSMVRLGKGQAILGGTSSNGYQAMIGYQAKIYSMTCSNRNCIISLINRELSVPKEDFVAIPIPDTISGCITGGKNDFWKITLKSTIKLACVKSLFWKAIQSNPKQSESICFEHR